MIRKASFLLGLVLAGTAAAQTRVAAPVEVRLAVPTASLSAPTALTVTPLTLSAPAFSAAPTLSAASLPSAALAAPVAAVAAPALAAQSIIPAAAASPADLPAAAPASALAAASSLVPRGEDEASVSASAQSKAAAFDGSRPLNVLMAGAEAVPFIKTGGLADVVDAVARGLAARGHNVMMVLPNYASLKKGDVEFKRVGAVSVPIEGRQETAQLLAAKIDGVNVVLLDHPGYYHRSGGPYDGNASSYGNDDNDERFAFFSHAALAAARALDFRPDVVHAHDWHAALIPAFLTLFAWITPAGLRAFFA